MPLTQTCSKYLFVLFVVVALSGCDGDSAGNATVSGFVTLDGEPLNRGVITFSGAGEDQHSLASGQVAPNGSYVIQVGRTETVVAGEYDVSVSARAPSIESPSGGPPTPGPLITPARYSTPEKSGLRYRIRPGENVIDIALSTPGNGLLKERIQTESENEFDALPPNSDEAKVSPAGGNTIDSEGEMETTAEGSDENGKSASGRCCVQRSLVVTA